MPPPLVAAGQLGISYRSMGAGDLEFVGAVYASTRAAELAVTGWTDLQARTFLAQQHRAQHHHYQTYYDGAEWLVIERRGEDLGRLYLAAWKDEIRIIDIALLPGARGRGIGGAILSDVIEWARRAGKGVSIHVEKHNPARRLYERLGFRLAEEKGVYDLMECAMPVGRARQG